MNVNSEKIKALKNSGKVIGHERGFLDPVENTHLTVEERETLNQENANRREYFSFLARNSIHPTQSYEQVAQKLAKEWKEWPPKQ